MKRFLTIVVAALSLGASVPASAAADDYHEVLSVYEVHGSIPPCRFTSSQLEAALRGVDAYGQQYFADFTDAVLNALSDRASGACSPGGIRARSGRVAVTGPAAAGLPPSVTSATSAGVPGPMLALGVLILLGAALAGMSALSRMTGREPRWAAAWRHSWAETGYRAGTKATWMHDALRAIRRRVARPNRRRRDAQRRTPTPRL